MNNADREARIAAMEATALLSKAKHTAIEKLRDSRFEPLSTTLESPSVKVVFDGNPITLELIHSLQEAMPHLGSHIIIAPDNSSATFVGEETLYYLARKKIHFPGDEPYVKGFDLGQEMVKKARDQALLAVEGHPIPSCNADIADFLKRGAYVNARDGDHQTALHYIALTNDVEAAATLLKAGINPNASHRIGDTALHLAVDGSDNKSEPNDHLPMIKLLLEHGANPMKHAPGSHSPLKELYMRALKNERLQPIYEIMKSHQHQAHHSVSSPQQGRGNP